MHRKHTITDFAGDSRHANPWAFDLYNRARARGHDHPHAWLYVIWHGWQDHTAHDPTRHHALQRFLATQNAVA